MLLRRFSVAAVLALAVWAIEVGAIRADTFTVTTTNLDGTPIDANTNIFLQVFRLIPGGQRGDPGTVSTGSETYTLGDRIPLAGEETFGAGVNRFVALRKTADGTNQVVFTALTINVPAGGDRIIVFRFFRKPPGAQPPTPAEQPQTDIPAIIVRAVAPDTQTFTVAVPELTRPRWSTLRPSILPLQAPLPPLQAVVMAP